MDELGVSRLSWEVYAEKGVGGSVSDPYSLNPETARNLIPDSDTDPSCFLTRLGIKFFFFHMLNRQKKSIERNTFVSIGLSFFYF